MEDEQPRAKVQFDKPGNQIKHFFIVERGALFEWQIRNELEDKLNKLIRSHPEENINKNYKLLINNFEKEGEEMPKGVFAFCWIDNEKLYNALVGKNFDGELIIEEVVDEDWVQPSMTKEEMIAELDENDFEYWAKLDEIDSMFKPPMIRIRGESMLQFDEIVYSEQQYKYSFTISKDLDMEKQADDFCILSISPYKTYNRIYEKNELIAYSIPSWATKEKMFEFFHQLSLDKTEHSERIHNDKNKKEYKKFKYPIIDIFEMKDTRPKTDDDWRTVKKGKDKMMKVKFSPLAPENAKAALTFSKFLKRVDVDGVEDKELIHFVQVCDKVEREKAGGGKPKKPYYKK